MKIKINVDTNKFNNDIERIKSALEDAIKDAIVPCAYKVEETAKVNCPVDTSRLRDSIHTEFDFSNGNYNAIVGTDVEYALMIGA